MQHDRLFFDTETDGLLPELTKLHSLVLRDVDTGEVFSYHGEQIVEGLERLASARMIIGHNAINFDIPAITKVYPWFRFGGWVVDTLILSKLIFPDIKKQIDFDLQKKGRLPGQLMGRHSLEAWGHRLGMHKGEYTKWCKEQGLDPWAQWRPEMQAYCEQDVAVLAELFSRFLRRMAKTCWKGEAISLEHAVKVIITRQERRGVCFDEPAAMKLHVELTQHKLRLEDQLREAFPPQTIRTPFVPKANNKARGYVKGELTYKERVEVFNPSSRQMIADRLKAKYGWEPTEFTDGGQPKIDEDTLQAMDWPEAAILNEYFMVEKRLSALAVGKEAWLKRCENGAIHGQVDTLGTATGRMSHLRPNLAQVVKVGKPYGLECRSLFRARPGYVLIGCDADALELRCLAHFLARHDGGAYIETILCGDKASGTDMHSVNCRAMGLDPAKLYRVGAIEISGREIAKTFFYALIYGAGDVKLGSILGKGAQAGRKARNNILRGIKGMGEIVALLKKKIKATGSIYGIDGRVLPIRSSHAALNTLLQSAGAVLMKKALVMLDERLQSLGLVPGEDYEFVLNVHDEWQIETKEQHAPVVQREAPDAIRRAGDHFEWRCLLAGNADVGQTWADTH